MEKKALSQYVSLLTEKGHQEVYVRQCGLFVLPNKIYVGASPDAMVRFKCCGEVVLEIKCPFSIMEEMPLATNVKYLCLNNDGHLKLKETHQYFTQVQTHQGVTGRARLDTIWKESRQRNPHGKRS